MVYTFTVPPALIYIAGGLIVGLVILYSWRKRVAGRIEQYRVDYQQQREIRRRQHAESAIREEQRIQIQQAELGELFHGPWLLAYTTCKDVGGTSWPQGGAVREAWFNEWMKRKNTCALNKLPRLSMPAVDKFAQMVCGGNGSELFRHILVRLSQFIEMPEDEPVGPGGTIQLGKAALGLGRPFFRPDTTPI